jgi:hypothetical protein
MIVGPREEPFLAAVCQALVGVCETLIVNDNAPHPSPHSQVLERTGFAREGRLLLDRTPFTDFAAARNICMRLHREHDAGDWIAFVDADEVHVPRARRIAANLHRVAPQVDFVDTYVMHFFQSFDWFMSIDRRSSFFRFTPQVHWEQPVHEQLRGLSGRRIALPYLYMHYGWVVPAQVHAMKGRQYSSLGAPGRIVDERHLGSTTVDNYFEFQERWQSALRFHGEHPPAARAAIERMRAERAVEFAQVDRLIASAQSPAVRARNLLRRANYEQRWRLRVFNLPALRLLA